MEFALDEHPNPKTPIEQLAKLPTVFKKDSMVTAVARIVGYSVARCEPTFMGIGPIPAIGAMLEKTGFSLCELDQIDNGTVIG